MSSCYVQSLRGPPCTHVIMHYLRTRRRRRACKYARPVCTSFVRDPIRPVVQCAMQYPHMSCNLVYIGGGKWAGNGREDLGVFFPTVLHADWFDPFATHFRADATDSANC